MNSGVSPTARIPVTDPLTRDLLSESGSVFVQIIDESLHHVWELMDEVFGTKNCCDVITLA
jgi:adenine-specific DNA-methyltransferase